ncbi:MAG: helix-turn-helix domain-containing protein [Candidatus Woesearchaeota archaeon]|jgi:sugar-specific transcriptional regulator TrmB
MYEEIFKELGFSEREIKVYLSLLELGSSKVGPLAAKTRMQHSKVYQTLEKLIDKGLVTYVMKSQIRYFQAEDPKHILQIIKEKENRFLEIMPELKLKQQLAQEPQIATVYEGYKAIKVMFDNLFAEMDKNSGYYIFALKEEYDSANALRFIRHLHLRVSEIGSDNRIILHRSIKKKFLKNSGDLKKIKSKFTSLKLPPGLMIINDRIINWSFGERPTAVEIKSKQISDNYKHFFLEVWNSIR